MWIPHRLVSCTNKAKLKSFLGMASHHRRFIKNFASLAAPLREVIRESAHFKWEPEQEEAFGQIKRCLVEAPILHHFDDKKEIEIRTDASMQGLGATIVQYDDAGQEQVVSYASRRLVDAEKRYHCNELECMAAVWAIDDKFRAFVHGRP